MASLPLSGKSAPVHLRNCQNLWFPGSEELDARRHVWSSLLSGRSTLMRRCPAGDVGEDIVEPLDHQFGHPAIVTWVDANPPATLEVTGGGYDCRANGDR